MENRESIKSLPERYRFFAYDKQLAVWLLAGMCLLIVLARLHTYNEPTDRDIGTYAVIAHEMLHGGRLYEGLLLDQKPPALHFTYATAEALVGYGRQELYLLGVTAAIATLFGAYFTGKNLTGSRSAGLWAAALWTTVSGDLVLEANQPNSEVFINAWIIFGLFFLFGQLRGMIPWQQAVLAGLCFAMASLYKHVIVVIPLCAGLALIAFPQPGRTRREAFFNVAIIGSIGVIIWGALFAYFWRTGRFDRMLDCLFRFNIHYSGNQKTNLMTALSLRRLFPSGLYDLIPLFFLTVGGMVTGFYQRQFFPWVPMVGLAIGTALAVEMPGHFFPHYYQLWIPFLILGSALSIGLIEKKKLPIQRVYLIAPFVLIALLANQVPSYFYSADEWSCEKYGQVFLNTDLIAKDIRQWLKPGETFYQLDAETQLYFDTGIRPQCALSVYGVYQGEMRHGLYQKTMDDVISIKPDLLVIGKKALRLVPRTSPFLTWIESNYSMSPVDPDRGTMFLCVKNGSDLQRRLKKP